MATAPKAEDGWHTDRRIQIGHIVSTIGLMLTMAVTLVQVTTYIGKVDARVQVLEAQVSTQHERDERQDKTTNEALALLRAQLERIDAKLDRILEKGKK